MSDKIQTLHPKSNPTDNVYPNIKSDNIPSGAITKEKMGFHLYNCHYRINVYDTNNVSLGSIYLDHLQNTSDAVQSITDLSNEHNMIGNVNVSGTFKNVFTSIQEDDGDYYLYYVDDNGEDNILISLVYSTLSLLSYDELF